MPKTRVKTAQEFDDDEALKTPHAVLPPQVKKFIPYEHLCPYNGTPFWGAYEPGDEKVALKKLDYVFIRKWHYFMKAVEFYYHFSIVTPENVPPGPCIFAVNHTFTSIEPWFGMFNLYDRSKLWEISGALDLHWFKFPIVRELMIKTGNIVVEHDVIVESLRRGIKVGILVGGVREAYKSSAERYQINWNNRHGKPKLGFIRCALETQVPIVPLAYVGSEEIFYVSKIKTDLFIKTKLINYQLPYVVFRPLPFKIYEVYGPPIYLDYPASAAEDEAILLKCFYRVKDEFMANMKRGMELKEENTRKYARKIFKSEHPRILKLLKPFC